MNFYNYMTRNFIDEDSPRGDLAKDMKMDKATFPKTVLVNLITCTRCRSLIDNEPLKGAKRLFPQPRVIN